VFQECSQENWQINILLGTDFQVQTPNKTKYKTKQSKSTSKDKQQRTIERTMSSQVSNAKTMESTNKRVKRAVDVAENANKKVKFDTEKTQAEKDEAAARDEYNDHVYECGWEDNIMEHVDGLMEALTEKKKGEFVALQELFDKESLTVVVEEFMSNHFTKGSKTNNTRSDKLNDMQACLHDAIAEGFEALGASEGTLMESTDVVNDIRMYLMKLLSKDEFYQHLEETLQEKIDEMEERDEEEMSAEQGEDEDEYD
jgi:hypothetical protein